MRTSYKRTGAVVAVLCLVLAVAFGGTLAWGDVPWQGTGDNKLTVQVEDEDIVVDVYQVATAQKDGTYDTFNYTWAAPFGTGPVDLSTLATAEAQDAKAFELAVTAAGGQTASYRGAPDGLEIVIPNLDDGLYLVLPHGIDEPISANGGTVALKRYTDIEEMTFKPSLLALPTKEADESGIIMTSNTGPWLKEMTIAPKFDKFPLFGKLRINKTVEGFTGEMATFVFHISGTTPDGDNYDNYASITCTNDEVTEAVVTHIPAGTVVTVTEEQYEGMRYTLKDGDTSEKTIVADRVTDVDAGQIPVASFVNEPGPPGIGGHGVQNNFELYTEDSPEKWDWILKEVSPASAQTVKPSNG